MKFTVKNGIKLQLRVLFCASTMYRRQVPASGISDPTEMRAAATPKKTRGAVGKGTRKNKTNFIGKLLKIYPFTGALVVGIG